MLLTTLHVVRYVGWSVFFFFFSTIMSYTLTMVLTPVFQCDNLTPSNGVQRPIREHKYIKLLKDVSVMSGYPLLLKNGVILR